VRDEATSPASHVALLRGLNVGGKNVLPMPKLAALFEEAGCADVRTYIQSGNVLFRAPKTVVRRLPQVILARIGERHGLRVPVILRTATELRGVAASNPFLATGADPGQLYVAFLEDAPGAAAAGLDPGRSPPDAFAVRGREVYLSLPNGVARTKITNDYLDRTLGTRSTVRNWRTVLRLAGLVEK